MLSLHFCIDDLQVAPGMSAKLKIKQNDQKTNTDINTSNTTLENEWAEDINIFWNEKTPNIVNQPDVLPEPIPVDEINHIKVINNFNS